MSNEDHLTVWHSTEVQKDVVNKLLALVTKGKKYAPGTYTAGRGHIRIRHLLDLHAGDKKDRELW